LTVFASIDALKLSGGGTASCSEFGGRKVVLVNLNHDYMTSGIFYNWYHYAQPFLQKADAQLVIDISHEDSKELLQMKELGDHHSLMYPDGSLSTISMLRTSGVNFAKAPFGSKGFTDLMVHRMDAMKSLLEKGCTVLQVDIDTVWRANPFEDIKDPESKTLVLTDDRRSQSPARTHLCGCFMYMTPKILSKTSKCNFFEDWIKLSRDTYHGNEQDGLNEVLRQCGADVAYDVLPRQQYAPGPRTDWHGAHIIHANYVTGLDLKIRFFKKHGLWHDSTDMWLSKTKA
jgi:hypothetical protein